MLTDSVNNKLLTHANISFPFCLLFLYLAYWTTSTASLQRRSNIRWGRWWGRRWRRRWWRWGWWWLPRSDNMLLSRSSPCLSFFKSIVLAWICWKFITAERARVSLFDKWSTRFKKNQLWWMKKRAKCENKNYRNETKQKCWKKQKMKKINNFSLTIASQAARHSLWKKCEQGIRTAVSPTLNSCLQMQHSTGALPFSLFKCFSSIINSSRSWTAFFDAGGADL